jgi:chemotaxis protein methyltransferase CheR
MKRTLSNNALLELSKFIALNFALHFPEERWDNLERNIISAAKEFGYQDTGKLIQYITSSPLTRESAEILASYLTINETYFWREPQTFKALEQEILPELISVRKQDEKRIRIWSAGCSTGEEPYSIAIVLKKIIPDIEKWNITILASDINPKILRKAIAGVYSQWSFRNTPHWLKEKYFIQKEKGKFEIIPEIKKMVTFEYLNLAEDVYPSPLNNTNALDIIFCRNVLMYFTHDRFKQVVKGLFNSLTEGGYLIVSASELSVQNYQNLIPVNVHGMVLYQKLSKKANKLIKYSIVESPPETVSFQAPPKPVTAHKSIKIQRIEAEKVILKEEKITKESNMSYDEILKLYTQGKYSDVINNLQKDGQTPDNHILLIRAYANLGRLAEASSVCRKAIAAEKLDSRLYYLYATILQESNQTDEAIASLKRAIYLDPDFILSYFSLGNIYKRLGNINKSIKYYRNILLILDKYKQDEILPESEGLTAGRFREIITATIQTRALL